MDATAKALVMLAQEGWANRSGGSVYTDFGYFALVDTEGERNMLEDILEITSGDEDTPPLPEPGWWLVWHKPKDETESTVERFDSETKGTVAFLRVQSKYAKWAVAGAGLTRSSRKGGSDD